MRGRRDERLLLFLLGGLCFQPGGELGALPAGISVLTLHLQTCTAEEACNKQQPYSYHVRSAYCVLAHVVVTTSP